MKKIFFSLLVALVACNSFTCSAFDIKEALGKVLSSDSTSTTISSIGSVISDVIGSQKVELKDLVGTWKYSAPAVSFKSDNLLQQAGGAAVASSIEQKILPFYTRSGITGLKVQFAEDSTFTMNVKKITAKGTISTDKSGNYVFSFQALGKVNVGTMTAYISKSYTNELSLTFDATKLMTLVEKVANYSNNTTLKTASTLLNSYDGITVGFKLKKQ